MKTDVMVIGGGAGGCGTSLALADSGFKVKLLEKSSKLLFRTSNVTPGRMGLGFHYIDFKTGAMYMKQTIDIVKKFPGFKLGENLPKEHPLRHGRYFIVKNSLFPKDDILKIYEQYQQEYARLVAEDPSNEVFGPPEKFFRILDPKEYENDVNMEVVEAGIETPEHLLDWPKFREFYIEKIKNHPNIEILTDCEVKQVKKGIDSRFELTVSTSESEERIFETDYAVNATWEQMEKVRKALDISSPSEGAMRNRLKVLLEVELPSDLKDKNSMFFCMGPHCMFSNMGDGRGLMSFAPKTNIRDWKVGPDIPDAQEIERLLSQKSTNKEIKEYGEAIREGVSKFIPKMHDAKILRVRFGIVKTRGNNTDIFDHKSDIHQRNEFGVNELIPGWIENNCMKLMYFNVNGEIVLEKLKNRIKQDDIHTEKVVANNTTGDDVMTTTTMLEILVDDVPVGNCDSSLSHTDPLEKDQVSPLNCYSNVFHEIKNSSSPIHLSSCSSHTDTAKPRASEIYSPEITAL